MQSRTKAALASLAVLTTVGAVAAVPPADAAGGGSGSTVIARGLGGPFGVQKAIGHRGFVVAENAAGKVTRVMKDGHKHAIVTGVPGVAGVAASPTRVFGVTGGPDENGQAPPGRFAPSTVFRTTYDGKHTKAIADLGQYELDHNPDGQVQFVDGHPVDALSNPFSMTWSRFGLFVADGGANDVLKVNPRTGKVSTFFAPPTVKDVPACQGPDANANPGTKGCDPVPTGVAVVKGNVWISTLGAEAPKAGRVYKLDARTGKVKRVWKGFTAPTGIAVRHDGTFYVSEVAYGAPEGDTPPPGFSPADVGRITRVSNGHRTHVHVTQPTGLALKNGDLYSTAWCVPFFFGSNHPGQLVKVHDRAFR